jgi:hypothetical protein
MGILLNKSKNYVINGELDFWQRGTSFAAIATAAYFADRFQYLKSGTMVHTVARSTDVPTNSFAQYSAFLDVTTAQASIGAAEFNFISHKVEGNFFSNLKSKTQTLRFKVKATKTGTYCIAFRNSAQDRTLVKEYTVNAANTWETKTITFTHDASGTWNYTTGIGLQIIWTIAAGTNLRTTADTWQTGGFIATSNQVNGVDNLANDFRITEVQLEEGVSASNFERAGGDFAAELQLCQRYFEKSYRLDVAPGTVDGVGAEFLVHNNTSSSGQGSRNFRVTKRATPTVTTYRPNALNSTGLNNFGNGATSSGANERGYEIGLGTSDGQQVSWHYTADAEL